MITSDQIRAARGLIRWSARQLAEKAGLSLPTIQRIEAADGIPPTSAKTLDAIQRTLEAAGIAFIPANGGGAGVRLRKSSR
jgi:transcriptional regulator with XRE-family HTH domain